MLHKSLTAIFFLLLPVVSHARVTDYWSFNSKNLNPNLGVATLEAHWIGFGIAVPTFNVEGTEVNALPGVDPGSALGFYDLATVASHHALVLSGLDFTGQSGVSLSYAVWSHGFFEIGEKATISYKIGDGAWSAAVEVDLPTATWAVREYYFGSALDNASNVSIRISHNAWFEGSEFLAFDNLTVTVVPEPAVTAVACAAGLGLLAAIRRRRKRS